MQTKEKRKSITSKVLLVVVVIVLFSGGVMGLFGYFMNRNAVIADYGQYALGMAQTASATVDIERFRHAASVGESDAYWQEMKQYLGEIRTGTRALWAYIVVPVGNNVDVSVFADGDDFSGVLPEAEDYGTVLTLSTYPDEIKQALRTGEPTRTGLFDGDGYGLAVGGYSAIMDGDEVIGMVCIELDMDEALASMNSFLPLAALALIVVLAIFLPLGFYAGNKILRKPLIELSAASEQLVRGNMNIKLDIHSKTDLGHLANDFAEVAAEIKSLIGAMDGMTQAHSAGDMDARIDASAFQGVYKDVAVGINGMVESYGVHMRDICYVLQEFGTGVFNAEYAKLPGKKAMVNDAVEGLRKNLRDVGTEISSLSTAATNGNLSVRADAAKYKGDWASLMAELNRLVESIADRAQWYVDVLDAVPTPIFATDKDMNWLFINKSCERMIGKDREELIGCQCNNFGANICNTPNCAINNFKKGKTPTNFEQGGGHYQVNVADLKDSGGNTTGFVEVITDMSSQEKMIERLNGLVANVKRVSDQVTDGARHIAESSQHLAEGAATQSSTVEELNSSIIVISEKTQATAKNSADASGLSVSAKSHAMMGNGQMKQMLEAMEGIKTASDNISKIIKTIEDIAFQTNLLALNAAVEAARAGDHGKGFAVVAEEVRSLAARSQVAAKETANLISESITRVGSGSEIAENTAKSLNTMVSDFDAISSLIAEIAAASAEQADSIDLLVSGISQISGVTQQNSASSQQAAAASQELAGQAETLKEMVSGF